MPSYSFVAYNGELIDFQDAIPEFVITINTATPVNNLLLNIEEHLHNQIVGINPEIKNILVYQLYDYVCKRQVSKVGQPSTAARLRRNWVIEHIMEGLSDQVRIAINLQGVG